MPTSTGATETSVTNQIVVVILNDDEPEIDEMFEVQLVSVAESGQRINPEQVSQPHFFVSIITSAPVLNPLMKENHAPHYILPLEAHRSIKWLHSIFFSPQNIN